MASGIRNTARVTTLCLAMILSWQLSASALPVQGPAPPTESVAELIADLDSPKFEQRQYASYRLRSLELESVPSLVNLALNGNSEQTCRSISILNEMGIQGDIDMVAKIGRVLFLIGKRRPELNEKAHLIRDRWKAKQTAKVVAELRQKGATVLENQFPIDPQARIAGGMIIRNGRLIDISESESPTPVKKTIKPRSKNLISVKQIQKQTLEIIKAKPADDLRALRAAAKLATRYTPAPVDSLPNQAFDITLDKNWRGTNADFEAILDLPKVDTLQLSNMKVSRTMMNAISSCKPSRMKMSKCNIRSKDLFAFGEASPDTFVEVRGRALMGVQGNVGRFSEGECRISSVVENKPADNAGLIAGDVIIQVDNQKIREFQDLVFYVAEKNPGEQVSVVVRRLGKKRTLKVKLAPYDSVAQDQ